MAVWKLPPLVPKPSAPPVQTAVVQADGFETVMGRLSALPAILTAAVLDGMLEVGEKVMEDSKENYCPVDSGRLKSSGTVFGQDDEVRLQYGIDAEGNITYTITQHEDPYHHPAGFGPVLASKFLERPMMEWRERIIAAAGKSLRATVEIDDPGVWGSGDRHEIRIIHDQRSNVTQVKGYTKKSGQAVKPYYRAKKGKK